MFGGGEGVGTLILSNNQQEEDQGLDLSMGRRG